MGRDQKRIVEVRMVVIVTVNLQKPGLTDAIAALGKSPSSLADVVSSEVVSNLESVSYVEAVIVSHF